MDVIYQNDKLIAGELLYSSIYQACLQTSSPALIVDCEFVTACVEILAWEYSMLKTDEERQDFLNLHPMKVFTLLLIHMSKQVLPYSSSFVEWSDTVSMKYLEQIDGKKRPLYRVDIRDVQRFNVLPLS